MNDIARLSGVARSTVHAVLTNKPWVSAATRQKILEVVKRYNYHPNRMAASLVGRPSNLIGLVLRDIMNPFNTQLLAGVNSALADENFSTLLLSTIDTHELEVRAVQLAIAYQVDGLIMAPLQLGVDLRHLWQLRELGKPFVTLGRVPGMETSHVRVEEEQIGRLAAEHLIEMGHRNICCLRGPTTALAAEERLGGYRLALLGRQIRLPESMIVQAGATLQEGYAAARQVLSRDRDRPTAIVCYNDLVAAGTYKAARELGLEIPRDLSVVGADDIELASVFGPPLTTVSQPCFEMGRMLAEVLLEQLRRPAATISHRFMPVLVRRDSVRRIQPQETP